MDNFGFPFTIKASLIGITDFVSSSYDDVFIKSDSKVHSLDFI